MTVMDIVMPELTGIEAAQKNLGDRPQNKNTILVSISPRVIRARTRQDRPG